MKLPPIIVIIGAGLTGLTLAYLLKKIGINATLLEARDRIGGRIHTIYPKDSASVELGATWLGQQHQDLIKLLKELNLDIFEQALGTTAFYEYLSTSPPQLVQLPPNNAPSFRIAGGTTTLIQRLYSSIGADQVQQGQVVHHIKDNGTTCLIQTQTDSYEADIVITTLPPNLLISTVEVTPALPSELTEIAKNTHTWMGESIKVAFTFEDAFWRTPTSSSTIMSNVGPVGEMYDHSTIEDTHYALKGFMNGAFHAAKRDERKQLILRQLRKYYGEAVKNHKAYHECVWRNEQFTFTPYDQHIFPHQHNGHPIFSAAYLHGKLMIGGSETATNFPGYMNGAVHNAYQIFEKINSRYS